MGRRTKETARSREMRGVLAELDGSGLTVSAFAKERGIAVSRLWHWRKRFRDAAKASPPMVPVTIAPSPPSRTGEACFVVEVKGRRIEVPFGFDAGALGRVVVALEAC